MAGVLISSLAALWVFTVVNLPGSPLAWLRRLLVRLPHGARLVACPWCLGFWLAAGAYLLWTASEGSWGAVRTPLGVLAAAGATGLLSGLLAAPDDDLPTE